MVTTTTVTPPVMFVCFGASHITMVVVQASTSVGLTTWGQHDVLLPELLLRDRVGGLLASPLCHSSNNLINRCLLRQMLTMLGPTACKFLFQRLLPINFFYRMLVYVLAFVFCFQVFMWLPCLPMGAQPLGFASVQPFGVYLWQAYVPPGNDLLPMAGVYKVAAPPTTSSRVEHHTTHVAVSQPFQQYDRTYSFGSWAESPNPAAFPIWQGLVLFFR